MVFVGCSSRGSWHGTDGADSGSNRSEKGDDASANGEDVRTDTDGGADFAFDRSGDEILSDGGIYGPDGASCELTNYPGVRICCGLPDDMPGGNCLLRESVEHNLATCLTQGTAYDLKDGTLGIHCCAGLVPVSAATLSIGVCISPPVSLVVCAPCGNAVCDAEENRCNCAVDCP